MNFSMKLANKAKSLCIGAAMVAASACAFAQQAADVRVNVNLKDADMMTATRMLFQKTGIQFVVEPSSKAYGKITLKLDDVTAEEAVKYICVSAGAYFRRDENGVFIISQLKPVAPVVEPTAASEKPLLTVHKIKVLKAAAQDVYDQVLYRVPFDSTRGFAELKRFTQLNSADMERIWGSQTLSIYGNSNSAPTSQFQPITSTSIASPLAGSSSSNDIQLPGESANQLGGRGGGGGGGFGGGQNGGGAGGNRGGGGQGGGGGQVNLQGGQGLVPPSIDYITYDPTDNSIVVRGTPDDIAELQKVISEFDVAPRQVQIKVEFISTQEGFDKDLGYEFQYQRGTVFAGTQAGTFVNSSAPVFLNYATGNIAMRLRASLTERNSKVENSPIVRTLNNQPAQIQDFTQTYIFLPQQSGIAGAGIVTTYQAYPITATTTLSVAPRINGDDTITVFLAPQIQSFQGTSVSPSGLTFPNLVGQAISVVARVKNNETIVLGGLTSKNDNNTTKKVPVLGDLPIIGQFFRSQATNRTSTELLIFVTPTIIEDDATG